MKLMIIALTMIISYCTYSQSDTLQIKLKSGKVEKIAISQIQKIQFENVTSVEENNKGASTLVTSGNYPNPFSQETTIEFDIETQGKVEVIIYDNIGNLIQTLTCENCPSGRTQLNWNTRNQKGETVPSGVYYYEIRTSKKTFAKQMLKVR